MQFLHPSFLLALGVLAIPIIIHLFHFRRFKKVYFTNVHLLKEIKEETSTRNKLRNLLILLARCAALAMLVFAFAQPIIKSGSLENVKNNAVEIFIDNSFSMQARNSEVQLLTYARDRAREIVNAHEESDQFLILTHDLEAKHQRYVDQKTALSFIDEINISPDVETLEDIANVTDRIRTNLFDHNHHFFLLSDFQENISAFSSPIDTNINVNLIPFRAIQENNVAITSAEWEAPLAMNNQSNRLLLKLHNYSEETQGVELRMSYEGQERPLGTVTIPAGSDASDTISVLVDKTGWHHMELSIDDYPIEFDNVLYTSFNIKERIDVMSIYENAQNSYLNSAFESINYFTLSQVSKNAIRYELLSQQELIVLDDISNISSGLSSEITKYVKNGGNLMVFPAQNANVQSYNNLLGALGVDRLDQLMQTDKKDVGRINTEEFVFNDVYTNTNRNLRLPGTARNYTLKSSQSSGKEWLLRYRDGSPYLQKFNVDKGNVYLCSAPLNANSNDLVSNAEVFVPMLYKMALSSGARTPLFYTIGQDDVIALEELPDASSERYLIEGPIEFIPGITSSQQTSYMDIRGQINQAGFYRLTNAGNDIYNFAFNYDRKESDVKYGDLGEVATQISPNSTILNEVALADLSGFISQQNEGIRLWRWCLILGMIFLLIESLLIRFWK